MKTILPCIIISLVVLSSCKRFDVNEEPVIEGEPTKIALTVAGDGIWTNGTKSYSLTDAQEKQIKSLDVLVFNSSGNLVTRQRVATPPTLTNSIITKSGVGMQIYVIANANNELNVGGTNNNILGTITKVSDLEAVKVTNLLVDVQNNSTMLMSGKATGVTINSSGINSVVVQMIFVAAKITVNIYSELPAGENFVLNDWKLGSLARYTYIFGRTSDAGNVANDGDFLTQASTNSWHDGTITVGANTIPVKTTTFYIFENRLGVTGNQDETLKSGNTAPARASRMVARGYHQHSAAVTGLDINLMFGGNSINNYDVKRGYYYTYNVKVKGLNNYDIDTRYTNAGAGFQADIMNTTLDAHYDFRPIQVGAFQGNSVIEVLDENKLPTTSGFWLKVSQKNITKFVDNGSGTYVRPKYTASEMVQVTNTSHTNLTSMENKMAYLYADEYLDDGATRNAFVRVTYTPSGMAALAPIEIPISQRGILLAGSVGMRIMTAPNVLSNASYVLGLEVLEEATFSITPGNLANERTMTMQYGFNSFQPIANNTYTLRNGYDNTLILSLSNIANGTLRAPYGRSGTSTISHQFYDAIYNVHAGRYCFEKNRDTDGDGVIKGTEIKWYLPSTEEQLLIYAAGTSWGGSATDRWTSGVIYTASSQNSTAQNMATVFSNGTTGANNTTSVAYVRCVRRM